MRPLRALLASPIAPGPIESRAEWWQQHRRIAEAEPLTVDQAILGGLAADRLGYAFASGYEAALRALVPDLPADRVASFCVTERGGAHPRSIKTTLTPAGEGRFRVYGQKRWVTLANDAGVLLVAATTGTDERGRNRIRVARVDSTLRGVQLAPLPETPFTPEIGHDEVRLEDVLIREADLLPGDGFDRYVRPFRTVEDVHVYGALFGYLAREIRSNGFPRALLERLAALCAALRALAVEDPSAPEVHVALAGIIGAGKAVVADVEKLWARTEFPAHARWERDHILLGVSEGARGARLDRAFEALGLAR